MDVVFATILEEARPHVKLVLRYPFGSYSFRNPKDINHFRGPISLCLEPSHD